MCFSAIFCLPTDVTVTTGAILSVFYDIHHLQVNLKCSKIEIKYMGNLGGDNIKY